MVVVGFVEVDSVPARLELNLSPKTVRAVCAAHAWSFFRWSGIEASKADTVGDGADIVISHGRVVV